jgi:predicted transcriptional regulator
MNDFWNEKYALVDLLFESNLSQAGIAQEMGVTQSVLSRELKELGLNWIKRKNRKMSRGASTLTAVLQKILPNERIINEYHVGEQLMVDIYCPTYKLGIEYHGRQHFDYVAYFHQSYEDFARAQRRDERKLQLCKEKGISMVVFRYDDDLSEDAVYQRILNALQQSEDPPSTPHKVYKSRYKGNPFYEEMKSRKREFNKELRTKIKEERRLQKYDDRE